MRISSINVQSFRGREEYYPSTGGEEGLKRLSGYYPASSVEKTLGKDHSFPKNKVYFADPMEKVTQRIKDNVDFVVYDNEPSYPTLDEVRRNYLENNRTNYRKQFEDIREYYYRRQMGGHAKIDEAQYQQWQAAKCTGLYDKAGDMRYKKEKAEDELKNFKSEKSHLQSGIQNTNKELEAQKELKTLIETHVKNLKSMKKPYEDLNKIIEKSVKNENAMYLSANKRVEDAKRQQEYLEELQNTAYYNEGREAYPYDGLKYGKYGDTTKTYEEVQSSMEKYFSIDKADKKLSKQANSLDKTIAKFENILKISGENISEMQNYVAKLTEESNKIDSKIKSTSNFIEECKSKLEPLFEELAKFYKEQGIKVIKK